ncbi:MAG: hypothetical protein ABW219_12710 [Ilumatobacteraceae bacterium]
MPLSQNFDPTYFSQSGWSERVDAWELAHSNSEFAAGNSDVARQSVIDPESGLRVVVNIGTHALLKVFPDGRYLNLYERPVIGDVPIEEASDARVKVDTALGLDGPHVYFGAVALGGVGVRFYGEYCMILKIDDIDPDPQLFDRDSYDILLEPINDLPERDELISYLKGSWKDDKEAMVLMKVLPELDHERRLATTGTISDLVLKDQEFIEVHIRPAQDGGEPRSFGPTDIEELRESPDEVAVASRLRERETEGLRLSDIEHEWLLRRESVARVVEKVQLPTRVVTQHGRGYQWK